MRVKEFFSESNLIARLELGIGVFNLALLSFFNRGEGLAVLLVGVPLYTLFTAGLPLFLAWRIQERWWALLYSAFGIFFFFCAWSYIYWLTRFGEHFSILGFERYAYHGEELPLFGMVGLGFVAIARVVGLISRRFPEPFPRFSLAVIILLMGMVGASMTHRGFHFAVDHAWGIHFYGLEQARS